MHLIHSDYQLNLSEQDQVEWSRWVVSGKSGLRRFPIPTVSGLNFWNRYNLKAFCRQRGGSEPKEYAIRTPSFDIEDYDFEGMLRDRWEELGKEIQGFGRRLFRASQVISTHCGRTGSIAEYDKRGGAISTYSSLTSPLWQDGFITCA